MPNFGPKLLEISCNPNKLYPQEIELNAAIQLKNYIYNNWKFGDDENVNKQMIFDDEEIIVISQNDKNYIRNNILDGIIFEIINENTKILKQLNQSVKKIIKFDFESIWYKDYTNKMYNCLNSGNIKKVYSGIILLHQVSKFYEYETDEKQKFYNNIIIEVNKYLILIFK